MRLLCVCCSALLMFVFTFVPSACGQQVIDIPPASTPASIGADTIVNVLPGGVLDRGGGVVANDGGVVNVVGGRVGELVLRTGAIANVESGGVNERFWAEEGGEIRHSGGRTENIFVYSDGSAEISGGAIETIGAVEGTSLTIKGVGFAIDGVPVSGLSTIGDAVAIDLDDDSVLTAILADGTPFGRDQRSGFQSTIIVDGVLILEQSAAPPTPTPGTIVIDTVSDLPFVGAGQTVQVVAGGRLGEQFRAGPGSLVVVDGGRIDDAFHAIGAEVQINSGTIGRRLNAYDNAIVTLDGGTLVGDARFYRSSTLNVESGEAGAGIWIREGATMNLSGGQVYEAVGSEDSDINISGGQINRVSTADSGRITITGGTIIDRLDATTDGVVELAGGRHTDNISFRGADLIVRGGDFRINGVPVSTASLPNVNLDEGVILSGIYADGTPFVLSGDQEDVRRPIALVESNLPPVGPSVVNVPSDPVPAGLRDGQMLVLDDGGELPDNYTASFGSELTVRGGTVGRNLEVIGAMLDASGGQFSTIDAFTDAQVTVRGTAEFAGLMAYDGAQVSIEGGRYTGGNFLRLSNGAQIDISDGVLDGDFEVDNGTVNITGGQLEGLSMYHFSTGVISGGNFSRGVSLLSGSHLLATGGALTGISTSIGDSDLEGVATTTATVDGATVGRLQSAPYSEITVLSGVVGETDVTLQGGRIEFHGGALGDDHEWLAGSVQIFGYDFQVDGVPIAELQSEGSSMIWNYEPGTSISGTMADGTPFNLHPNDNFNQNNIADNVLTLTRTAEASLPAAIMVPGDPVPYGAAPGQTVILDSGGSLGPNFIAAHDSVVEIRGGEVGENFEADRSQVTVSGGTVGDRWDVFKGATVTVTDGILGQEFEVFEGGILNIQGGMVGASGDARGGTVNISGGDLGSGFEALENSTVNIGGGEIASGFKARTGATVHVTGGNIAQNFEVYTGAIVNVSGGSLSELDIKSGGTALVTGGNIDDLNTTSAAEVDITGGSFGDGFGISGSSISELHGLDFKVDGLPIVGLDSPGNEASFSMASNTLFTGILADGTPFAFRSTEGDSISNLKLVRAPDLTSPTPVVDLSGDSTLGGVLSGQTLNLFAGGALPSNFNAGEGSTLNNQGGTIGNNFEAYAAIVNIAAGVVGDDCDVFSGSEFNISGGSIGSNLDAYSGATINLSGGQISRIDALNGSEINVSGGHLGRLSASGGSHVVWEGGTMGSIGAASMSAIGIHGVDFRLNGMPISGLDMSGDSVQFNIPGNAVLTATLSDGTPLVLGPFFQGQSPIASGVLTLVQTEQPSPPLPKMYHVVDQNAPRAVGKNQVLVMELDGQLPADFIAGTGSRVQIKGGEVLQNFRSFDSSILIEDGTIGSNFTVLMGSSLKITGGEFSSGFQVFDGAQVDIHGGMFPSQVSINSGAVIDIYGKSFLIGGMPIPELQNVGDSFQISQFSGQLLAAILQDDSELSWRLSEFASDPRLPITGISSGAIVTLHLIPEPSTAVLALLCLTWITWFRCR